MSYIPIPWYHGMENPYHIPLIPIPCHLIPYHVTLYHTISPHTIPCHLIPSFQSCHRVSGVLLRNMKNISAGCNTGPLGTIFCGEVLQVFADILSYKWRLDSKLHALKISSIGVLPCITSHLMLYILPRPFN